MNQKLLFILTMPMLFALSSVLILIGLYSSDLFQQVFCLFFGSLTLFICIVLTYFSTFTDKEFIEKFELDDYTETTLQSNRSVEK